MKKPPSVTVEAMKEALKSEPETITFVFWEPPGALVDPGPGRDTKMITLKGDLPSEMFYLAILAALFSKAPEILGPGFEDPKDVLDLLKQAVTAHGAKITKDFRPENN